MSLFREIVKKSLRGKLKGLIGQKIDDISDEGLVAVKEAGELLIEIYNEEVKERGKKQDKSNEVPKKSER